jgi:hypothetical protein
MGKALKKILQPRVVGGLMPLARFQGADGQPRVTPEQLAAINDLPQVLSRLTADDVIVRGMYLMNDQPMHESAWFVRKFDAEALAQAAPHIPGKPVLVNHTTYGLDGLPVGRYFSAEVGTRDDKPGTWTSTLFYMLNNDRGKDIAANIDGGLYAECSPTIVYDRLYCSICGADELDCEHAPGKMYEGQKCFAVMSAVTDVLEGSIAWAGMQKDTGLYQAAGRTFQHGLVDTDDALKTICERKQAQGSDPWAFMGGSPGT